MSTGNLNRLGTEPCSLRSLEGPKPTPDAGTINVAVVVSEQRNSGHWMLFEKSRDAGQRDAVAIEGGDDIVVSSVRRARPD